MVVEKEIIYAVLAVSTVAAFFAILIYFVEQKFKVIEDPKIDEVQALLPGANCGGCGFAGCRNFAEAIVKSNSLDNLNCPVGGNKVMADIAPILGLVAEEKAPQIAVVRCSGSTTKAPKKVEYDGPKNCFFANSLYAGESGCPHGCLGLGDCVVSCKFDAIYIDNSTGLPVVSEENCVACGACVKACPRTVIELRNKGPKGKRIFVSCINKEKGAISKKNCEVACIGCGKCVKQCAYDAIKLENNLAYIDFSKCKLCRKCAPECPTGAILELNFPERKTKEESNTTVTENS